ncbi:MAG: thioesterase domain-containing protein [Pseudomonadota bacterium]
MFRVILKGLAGLTLASCLSLPAQAVEVYMFKGAGDFSFVNENMHFSLGLVKMSKVLNKEGIHSEVRRFGAVDDAYNTIMRRKPKSIALIGHSMGALASMSLARRLKTSGIRISYMGLIDIPGPVGVAGNNVEWAENYFSINPVYGRLTNTRSHPKAKNIHVAGYIHNRMDDSPKVQNGMLKAVRAVHAAENRQQPEIPETRHAVLTPQAATGTTYASKASLGNNLDQDPSQQAAWNANAGSKNLQGNSELTRANQSGSQSNQEPHYLPSVLPDSILTGSISQ